MKELGLFLIADLLGCGLITLLLFMLTSPRPRPYPRDHRLGAGDLDRHALR